MFWTGDDWKQEYKLYNQTTKTTREKQLLKSSTKYC